MSDVKAAPAIVTLRDKRDIADHEPSERQVIISESSYELLTLDFSATAYGEPTSSVDIRRVMHTENHIITFSEAELRAFVGAALSWLRDRDKWVETQRDKPEREELPF